MLTGFMVIFNLLMMGFMNASGLTLVIMALTMLPATWGFAQWFFKRQLQQLLATSDL